MNPLHKLQLVKSSKGSSQAGCHVSPPSILSRERIKVMWIFKLGEREAVEILTDFYKYQRLRLTFCVLFLEGV